ncbi:hypothetical protein AMTR_s00046p00103820 [Amborella trichopoda]|uniref:Uncharacterized protein n=1 Tax=Amborella trichopoda TaxID=13333 RepID=U5D970_AMBTC|nr:hypothetical protein AMTR_s00046p00103820 [Amborella trichopoda]
MYYDLSLVAGVLDTESTANSYRKIGDPPIPVDPCPPSREHSARGSSTRSSSSRNSRRADQAPLRAAQPSVRLAIEPSMAQFPLGASQPEVDNLIDPARIAQAILQAIGNPSLGQAKNFSAQPNLGPPQPGQEQLDSGMVPSRPIFELSY